MQEVQKSNSRTEQKENAENTFTVSYHSGILQTPGYYYNYINIEQNKRYVIIVTNTITLGHPSIKVGD